MDIDIKKLPVPKIDILNSNVKNETKENKKKKKEKTTYKYLDQLFKKKNDIFLKKYFE